MIFIDKHGFMYLLKRRKGEYYLFMGIRSSKKKKCEFKLEVKGKRNISMFIKNNELKRIDECETNNQK